MSDIPIYVINLKRTPERKLHIQRQFDAFDLNCHFVDAIDKYDLLSKENRARIANQLNLDKSEVEHIYRNVKKGHACTLSHIKIYNLMIKHNIPVACVLEDDGYILPDFPEVLANAQKVPWDILMLASRSSVVNEIIMPLIESLHKERETKPYMFFYFLYKLLLYKKYFPCLNPYTFRRITMNFVHYVWTKFIHKLQSIPFQSYGHASRIGAIPVQDMKSWYKLTPNHRIAKPYSTTGSTEVSSSKAYILTLSMAIKWRQKALSSRRGIDLMLNSLALREDINIRLLIPPCIIDSGKYSLHSTLDHN